jgi:hypothetical protein
MIDVLTAVVATDRASDILGRTPKTMFEAGLQRTID